MPRRVCLKHPRDYPCTCGMGNLYRFVEPVVLLLLEQKGRTYGYELSSALSEYALTDAEIERAALYRTLRQLEATGNVTSEWDVEKGGPARRIYRLTAKGRKHLEEWTQVLQNLSFNFTRFVKQARGTQRRTARKSRA